MSEQFKISPVEFLFTVITFTIGATILVIPGPLAEMVKQDAWIASALTTFVSLLFVFLFNQLAALYPSMTYVEYHEKILGKWLGKIVALCFLLYLFELSSSLLIDLGNFFATQIMVDTPIVVIMILFLFTSLIGVRLGLEVICRSVIIFFPWIAFLLFILILFLLPEVKMENIQPIFGEGIKPILRGSFLNLGFPYVQLAVFLMITPFVSEKAKIKKAFYVGVLISGWILFMTVLLCISVLGADTTARITYPSYILGKRVNIGNFLERIEVIVALIWMISIYFKLTICYFVLSLGLAQLMKLRNYRVLLFPLAFCMIPYAILSEPNTVYYQTYNTTAWTPFSLTICFVLPLLLFVIAKIKKKLNHQKET